MNKQGWYAIIVIVLSLLAIALGVLKLWAAQNEFHDWRCTVHVIECRKVKQ